MKYRKKPVVIDAIQWDGTNVADVREFFGGFTGWVIENCEYILITTLEGVMRCGPRDWIIKGVSGEFYPCKPGIFAMTYDEAK